ncbi:MAG: tetratricopeptide repeat protein, partial [Planctomycetota bacterium]
MRRVPPRDNEPDRSDGSPEPHTAERSASPGGQSESIRSLGELATRVRTGEATTALALIECDGSRSAREIGETITRELKGSGFAVDRVESHRLEDTAFGCVGRLLRAHGIDSSPRDLAVSDEGAKRTPGTPFPRLGGRAEAQRHRFLLARQFAQVEREKPVAWVLLGLETAEPDEVRLLAALERRLAERPENAPLPCLIVATHSPLEWKEPWIKKTRRRVKRLRASPDVVSLEHNISSDDAAPAFPSQAEDDVLLAAQALSGKDRERLATASVAGFHPLSVATFTRAWGEDSVGATHARLESFARAGVLRPFVTSENNGHWIWVSPSLVDRFSQSLHHDERSDAASRLQDALTLGSERASRRLLFRLSTICGRVDQSHEHALAAEAEQRAARCFSPAFRVLGELVESLATEHNVDDSWRRRLARRLIDACEDTESLPRPLRGVLFALWSETFDSPTPEDSEDLWRIGAISLRAGEPLWASRFLDAAKRTAADIPEGPIQKLRLGQAELEHARLAIARDDISKAADCLEAATTQLEASPDLLSKVYRVRAQIQDAQDESDAACSDLETALALAERSGNAVLIFDALFDSGTYRLRRDQALDAQLAFERALEVAHSLESPVHRARSLERLGDTLSELVRPADAVYRHEESLRIFRLLGDDSSTFWLEYRIGEALFRQGAGSAIVRLQVAAEYFSSRSSDTRSAEVLSATAAAHAARGKFRDALIRSAEALEKRKRNGNAADVAKSYLEIGTIYRQKGDYKNAFEFCKRASFGKRELNSRLKRRREHELAKIYLETEELGYAFQSCQAALKNGDHDRDHLDVQLTFARVLSKAGATREATKRLDSIEPGVKRRDSKPLAGRLALERSFIARNSGSSDVAWKAIHTAESSFRASEQVRDLAETLLLRAALELDEREFNRSQATLDEVYRLLEKHDLEDLVADYFLQRSQIERDAAHRGRFLKRCLVEAENRGRRGAAWRAHVEFGRLEEGRGSSSLAAAQYRKAKSLLDGSHSKLPARIRTGFLRDPSRAQLLGRLEDLSVAKSGDGPSFERVIEETISDRLEVDERLIEIHRSVDGEQSQAVERVIQTSLEVLRDLLRPEAISLSIHSGGETLTRASEADGRELKNDEV